MLKIHVYCSKSPSNIKLQPLKSAKNCNAIAFDFSTKLIEISILTSPPALSCSPSLSHTPKPKPKKHIPSCVRALSYGRRTHVRDHSTVRAHVCVFWLCIALPPAAQHWITHTHTPVPAARTHHHDPPVTSHMFTHIFALDGGKRFARYIRLYWRDTITSAPIPFYSIHSSSYAFYGLLTHTLAVWWRWYGVCRAIMNTQNGCDSRNLLSIWRIILDFFLLAHFSTQRVFHSIFCGNKIKTGNINYAKLMMTSWQEMLFLSYHFYCIWTILIGAWFFHTFWLSNIFTEN